MPIVEPEILMDGDHTIQRCFQVTEQVLKILFYQLFIYRIELEGMILKPNMVIAGTKCTIQNSVDEVADATVNCLLASVSASVPAVAFLSGGQSPEDATQHLNAMNKNFKALPWILTFSFARAIQQPAIEAWKGKDANVKEAQKLLYQRAKSDVAARRGNYNENMETRNDMFK